MKVVAVGGRAFVTGFVLSGVTGEYVSSPKEALDAVNRLTLDPTVGLVMVSDEVSKPVRDELTAIRSKRAVPLVYEVPGPGSKQEAVDYRTMLRSILGV
ncbi:MAG TPA: V-type ATP synthase subunit F [Nitrososphaerales archaeon]|nr:V-type ATP synthase subunit F [Nitrososphaerales archaeon]